MAMPSGIGVIDLMLGIPTDDPSAWYEFLRPQLLDAESRKLFKMPAQYMFKDVPEFEPGGDHVALVLREMDKVGIERAMIDVDFENEHGKRALKEHPDRFFGSCEVNPNRGMEEVRKLVAPWTELAVKLLLKWPNLYYSTSAFAPRHYPRSIVDYANTRGADKVLYAGYFPMGLSLERIFRDMPDVPFRDHVWPKFLRENALRVFKL
jgi:predicted TIM-barrel fold metal-dependent hydrolase